MNEWPKGYRVVRDKLLHHSYNRHKIYVFLLSFVVYALYHASRKPISIAKTVLAGECDSKDKSHCKWAPFDQENWASLFGGLEYGYLAAYAVSLIVMGRLAEHSDLRKFLTIGMLLSGLSTVLFGLARVWNIHSYGYFLLVQIFAGVVQASGWPAVVALLANWCGEKRVGFILGLWNSNGALGNVIGALIAGYYAELDWGLAFIIPGILLMVDAIFVFLFLVEKPENLDLDCTLITKSVNVSDSAIPIRAAIWLPNVISYACLLFFNKIVISTFMYWLPSFILSQTNASSVEGAQFSTIFDFGSIVGGIVAGAISDGRLIANNEEKEILETNNNRTRRAMTCATMLFLSCPLMIIYLNVANELSLLATIFLFLTGVMIYGPCSLIMTAVSADLGRSQSEKAVATVTAILDATGSIGAAFGPFLTGHLVAYGWSVVFTFLGVSALMASLIAAHITVKLKK